MHVSILWKPLLGRWAPSTEQKNAQFLSEVIRSMWLVAEETRHKTVDSPAAGVKKKKSQNYKGKHATMEGENN